MERTTQIGAVLDHMRRHGSITSMEAIESYGATRLSGLIYELKRQGHAIETRMQTGKNRFGGTCTYARYFLKDENARSG